MSIRWHRLVLGYLIRVSAVLCTLMRVLVVLADDDPVKIKIVEAPALSRFPSMPGHDRKLTLRAKPSPLTGPPHLQQLSNNCYTAKDNGYTYNICMFQNITQDEDRVGWNTFHGVLGVWHEWIVENDTFTGMHYTMGDTCSSSDREAMVIFNCSASTKVHQFTEPKTCHYHMVLDTPLACFKGAMQVYHVLSPEQLKEWDEIDHLYFADEITHKGRTKKRRKLLMKAGLLQEAKKVEITPAPETHPLGSTTQAELTQCVKDKEKLQKDLQSMKATALRIVKDYPELHYKMGLVFNNSASSPGPPGSPGPPAVSRAEAAAGKGAEVEDLYGEEALLSDDVMDTLAKDLRSDRKVESEEPGNDEEGLDVLLNDININDL